MRGCEVSTRSLRGRGAGERRSRSRKRRRTIGAFVAASAGATIASHVLPEVGIARLASGVFEFEIPDDETVTSSAVALPDVAAIKADCTAGQEHDRDTVVVSDVARCLTWPAGLDLGFPVLRDHHRINIGTAANSTVDPLSTATAQQRSNMLMLPLLPWVRYFEAQKVRTLSNPCESLPCFFTFAGRSRRTEAPRATQTSLAAERRKFAPSSGLRKRKKRRSVAPLSPVRRPQGDDLLGARFQPTVENAPARKHQRMRAVIIYDRQLEITVERGVRDRLPLHGISRCLRFQRGPDSNQIFQGNSGERINVCN
jgi:hypothetical protein